MTGWVRPAASIAALAAVIVAVMVATGMGPNIALVAALSCLIGVGVWAVTDLAGTTAPPAQVDITPRTAPDARTERRVTRLRTGLAYAGPNGLVFEQLHTSLVSVIDDQLRAAHQIDRVDDPAAAHAVIGADLQAFIDDTATAVADLAQPRSLDRILTLIEQL